MPARNPTAMAPDGEAERVLLREAGGLAHLPLDLLGVRGHVARLLAGQAEAAP